MLEARNIEETKKQTEETIKPRLVVVGDKRLPFIESGRQTLYVGAAFKSLRDIKAGRMLEIISDDPSNTRSVKVEVLGVRYYSSWEDILKKEDVTKIAPEIYKEQTKFLDKELFRKEDIIDNNLMVIEFEKI